ncbi:MAG: hypothetical protein ABJA70_03175 [Chryseolinea sp.]
MDSPKITTGAMTYLIPGCSDRYCIAGNCYASDQEVDVGSGEVVAKRLENQQAEPVVKVYRRKLHCKALKRQDVVVPMP